MLNHGIEQGSVSYGKCGGTKTPVAILLLAGVLDGIVEVHQNLKDPVPRLHSMWISFSKN